jgi:hypothetical protein
MAFAVNCHRRTRGLLADDGSRRERHERRRNLGEGEVHRVQSNLDGRAAWCRHHEMIAGGRRLHHEGVGRPGQGDLEATARLEN